MATATIPVLEQEATGADGVVELRDIGWRGYRSIRAMRRERPAPRLLYLDGTLTLVTPSMARNRYSRRHCSFIMEMAVAFQIPCIAAGSTTWGRRDLDAAVEGDETFLLPSRSRRAGLGLPLQRRQAEACPTRSPIAGDRPTSPGLAVEIGGTYLAARALEVYRRLGVPEVWVFTRKALRFFRLGDDGEHHETDGSVALPFLAAAEVFDWINRPLTITESEWVAQVRAWVRDVLVPRVRGGEAGDA